MNWTELALKLFGTTEFLGLNLGFWISMAVVTLLVVVMNIVFWCMKPQKKDNTKQEEINENLLM